MIVHSELEIAGKVAVVAYLKTLYRHSVKRTKKDIDNWKQNN
jgi:hypothetical protein